ncbi:hypothetical protein Zmor_019361 [Zophobas morio]|uniref:RING finger and CHY zinc finger domain-containing protein 1 n=1 Tax=Zophobas morio TaxID=2755281 RepID=A0AA38M937_9CUCU|nr:hypothetical protein Zmor_019361 [Zophobas morio]
MATSYGSLGCQHYKRKCKFETPCCKKFYTCHFCHDEQETHTLDTTAIVKVVCLVCHRKQKVQNKCVKCRTVFGRYFCSICNLFDDDASKGQFHCADCGMCRTGGFRNFFHCETCNMCLALKYKGVHKCIENRSRTDCPVCLEYIHTSTIDLHFAECGHLVHQACFEELQKKRIYMCPICKAPWKAPKKTKP